MCCASGVYWNAWLVEENTIIKHIVKEYMYSVLDTWHWQQKTDASIQNNGDMTVWTMCCFPSYLEQSWAIHHPVKVLHNGRGPQKIKQERNFEKEKGDLIHTSSCDWRKSEGL